MEAVVLTHQNFYLISFIDTPPHPEMLIRFGTQNWKLKINESIHYLNSGLANSRVAWAHF